MTGVVAIRNSDELRKASRRDMNRIGLALIALIALQLIVSTCVYFVVAANSGAHFSLASGNIPHTISVIRSYASKNVLSQPFALFFATIIANVIPFAFCARVLKINISEIFSKPKVSGGTAALFGTVGIGASIFVSMFVNIAALLLKFTKLRLTTPSFKIPWNSPLGAAAMLVSGIILAPLTEEFICRGVLLRSFRRFGDVFAVVASSLVWALLHGNFVQGLPVFAMGIFFGMLALKADSIIPTFIIHALNNTIAFASSSVDTGNMLARVYAGLFIFVILIMAIVLFSVFYKKFSLRHSRDTSRGFAAFFTCIPVLIVIIFCTVMTVMSVKPL